MEFLQRAQAAVVGAVVGDAASLGFHWLYDGGRIRELAPETPEFRTPSAADYEGIAGYFAADGKQAGDSSHYGAQLLVALRSLHDCEGKWNPFHYQSAYCTTFDRGGTFAGYIDGATTGTLNRVKQLQGEVLQGALDQVDGLTDSQKSFFKKYVPKKGVLHEGAEFEDAIVGMAALVYREDDMSDKARAIVKHYDSNRTAKAGADDNQLPAVSKLAVVVAKFAQSPDFAEKVEEAIRVTNDNEQAVIYGLYAARVLQMVMLGSPIKEALETALAETEDEKAKVKLTEALSIDTTDLVALGRHFGPACPLPSAIPVSVALLKDGNDYLTTLRNNIWVSGDNAGRATWLGAVLGAHYGLGGEKGVPFDWMSQTSEMNSVLPMLASL